MKRLFVCALALALFGCDSSSPEASAEVQKGPILNDSARRERAEAVVAKAKARESLEALSEVELSPQEEETIRKAAAAEVNADDVPGAIDALEAQLKKELESPDRK